MPSSWGVRTVDVRDIRQIIVHHSASPVEALTWAQIRDIHVKERGWSDIGYHAGVVNDADGWLLVKGRDEDQVGAHCKGHNAQSLGICFEGNYSLSELPREAFLIGGHAILAWMRRYGVKWIDVIPHRQLSPTECPGKAFPFNELVGWLRDRV